MDKLLILGFNGAAPRGGMLDLLTIVDTESAGFGVDVISHEMTITPACLQLAVAVYPAFEHYQVVHFDMYGNVMMIEHWKRAPFLFIPKDHERLTGALFEDSKGNYVRRDAIQHECGTSVGYAP
jgi:hypothetical protein